MTRSSAPTKTEPTERETAIAKAIVSRLVKTADNSDRKRKGSYQKGRGTRVLREVSRLLAQHLEGRT